MAYSINVEKELAQSRRPLLLAAFTFPDNSVYRCATMACTFGGNTYAATIDKQSIDQLAALSEQGVDRIPSATIRLADPAADIWNTWERAAGKGFKGASVTLTFALYDPCTEEFSADSFIPFPGLCDQPSIDDQYITITAQSKLNLQKYALPCVPIQVRCPWVNPETAEQRTLAADPNSQFYRCGETRDLTTAPPCSYTKQTCTQLARYGGCTWQPEKTGTGREYISGNKVAWTNPDTSGKYKKFWPHFLGGKAWIDAVVLNQWADGNYTRGEAAIGVGEIEVQTVVANGVELDYSAGMTGDYRWHYVNNGARDGAHNEDVGYDNGDPYGNLTVIQFLAPHGTIQPNSEARIRVLARRKKIRVYRRIVSAVGSGGNIVITFDGANEDCAGNPPFTVTVEGNSLANGTHELTDWQYGPPGTITLSTTGTGNVAGGTLWYETSGVIPGSLGGASTPWVLAEALTWTRFTHDDLDVGTFADAAKVCNTSIAYTDQDGNPGNQPRFSTAIALTERRSVADIVRGLRQSIGGLLVPGSDGKLRLQIEGPLPEQQPAPVPGSNYDTPIAGQLRDDTVANGYVAYWFDDATGNYTGLKRIARPISESPNRVQFAFSDPANQFAVSDISVADPYDVARIDQENPGGLAVSPEGIASQNHAFRSGKLGLAKIHRGNPVGDTRGTDWWEWQTSFRACRLTIGQLVAITSARYGLDKQVVRITEIKPSRNYETVTLRGHYHNDSWYADTGAELADPGIVKYEYGPPSVPGDPTFGVVVSDLDPTAAEVSGLTFAEPSNDGSVASASFTAFYVDETNGPATTLVAQIAADATSLELADATDFAEGDYVLIDGELILLGAPAGAVFPITRAQLDSAADIHYADAGVLKVLQHVETAAFPPRFFAQPEADQWSLAIYLPDMKLVAVSGYATNAHGNSATHTECVTGNVDHGLRLTAPPPGAVAATIVNKVNENATLSSGWQVVYVTATSQACTITMPPVASNDGIPITVVRAPGSTYDVNVEPGGSDTLGGSSDPQALTQDGESRTWTGSVAADPDNWIETSSAGTQITPPPPPDAPNVTGGTCVPYYATDGTGATESATGTFYGFRHTLTLPVSDPDYSHLRYIEAWGVAPDGIDRPLGWVPGPFSGNTVTFKSDAWDRPAANAVFTNVRYLCFNDDTHPSTSPYTITGSVTVLGQPNPPDQPTGVSCSEHLAERYLDDLNQTHTYIYPVATYAGGTRALWTDWWLSRDNGVTWAWLGRNWLTETAKYDVYAPMWGASAEQWKVKASSGCYTGDNSIDVAVVSASFSVAGASAVPAIGATSITNASATYEVHQVGNGQAFFPTVTWTNATDVNFFHPRLTVQLVNQTGSPAPWYEGTEREVTQADYVAGAVQTWKELNGWTLPKASEPVSGYRYWRLRLKAVTHAQQETTCNCWPGGAAYYDLYVSESQQVDPGTIDPTQSVPGDYTLGTVTYTRDDAGQIVLRVPLTNPGVTTHVGGFVLQVELPDQSASAPALMDGSVLADGTYTMGGIPQPKTFGPFAYSATQLPVVLPPLADPGYACQGRVRVASISKAGIQKPWSTAPSATFSYTVSTGPAKPAAANAYCENATWGGTPASASAPYTLSGKLEQDILFTGITPPADPKWSGWEIWSSEWPDDTQAYCHTGIMGKETASTTVTVDCPASVIPVRFWLRSVYIDANGTVFRNPLVYGATPAVTVNLGTTGGTVDLGAAILTSLRDTELEIVGGVMGIKGVDFTKAFNFNTDEFKITPGVGLEMNGVDFAKGFHGFDVGSAAVPKITVAPDGVPLGWIGKDAASGYSGAWLKRLLIGGASPADAPLFADSSGNVVAKTLLIYDADTPLGWIGAKDGYQGAWFKRVLIGGATVGDFEHQIIADAAGNVSIPGILIVGAVASATSATNASSVPGSGITGDITAGGSAQPITKFAVLDGVDTQVLWAGKVGSDYGIWAKNAWFGGSGPSDAKIKCNANGTVSIDGSVIVGAVAQATTAVTANSATTANSASSANTANTANSATTANTANTANTVPGSGVTGTMTAGGSAPTLNLLQVNDAANALCAWVGKYGSDYGIWGRNVWIGGSGPATAKIKGDIYGNVTITDAPLTINNGSQQAILNTSGLILTTSGATNAALAWTGLALYSGGALAINLNLLNLPGMQSGINVTTSGGARYMVNNVQVVGAQGAAVADPTGGTVVDTQCRAQLSMLLARLRSHGLIAT